MSDTNPRHSFTETILAEPIESSHRLIYADWLEENGDLHKAEGLRTLPGLTGLWSSGWGRDQYGLWSGFTIKDVSQKVRWTPPGTFWMGSPDDERARFDNEGPRDRVELTRGYWLADTPCTQEMWQVVTGNDPVAPSDMQRPVESVSAYDCVDFFERANELVPGLKLRFPTEAEWEYACRAGTESARYQEEVDAIAWYRGNSDGKTQPVAIKNPNACGLYDTLGNVWEWCVDGYSIYQEDPVVDPVQPNEEATLRIIRGGSWSAPVNFVRAAARFGYLPHLRFFNLGLRCLSDQ